MNILVKYPSRNRPDLLRKNLKEYWEMATNKDQLRILVSIDEDDLQSIEVMQEFPYVEFYVSKGVSKIEACNRDIEKAFSWDIVVLLSDDMFCKVTGWDERIRDDFKKYYPDTDGCLWYHDGSTQKVISTLSVIGRQYYERFGYIYHPSYKSFFCDNEYTEVAQAQGKIKFINHVLFRHEHPNWGGAVKSDELYLRNDVHWKHDQDNYHNRKALNFPV